MPRTARVKFQNATYHVMMRSISEITLFRTNRDKDKFLNLLCKYKEIFIFKILAYCIMDTHVHLLINANGADVSKFMHAINQSYAQYYNKKYNRCGHVFADRFKSKIAKKDSDLLCISAYIHNNPKDVRGYKNCVENYKYSSFGIYLGKRKDKYNIVNPYFILNYYSSDPIISKKNYYKFVKNRLNSKIDDMNKDEFEFINIPSEYISGKKILTRNANPKTIIDFVSKNTNIENFAIKIKYSRRASDFKALCIFLIRSFCDLKFAEISNITDNLTMSALSKLCSKGYILAKNNSNYQKIIIKFLKQYQQHQSISV